MPILDSPDFGHAFVPIDSLTSSPRSSTGSASVLEWNSNSSSEGLSLRSLDNEQHFHNSPPTPRIPSPLSPNPPSPKEYLPNNDIDRLFASIKSAAPKVDSVSNTVTSDTFIDEYRNLLGALEGRLTLQESVTQWQNHSYRETAAGLDRPETPSVIERPDNAVQEKHHNSTAPSPNRSVGANSSISAVTATPTPHVSSLFLPPAPPKPHVYPTSLSVVSDRSESEGISIAQYFQLKAAKAEEVPVHPAVGGPPRPISAASCLSYASTVESLIQTPVVGLLPDRGVEAPLLHETWHDLIPKVGKDSSSTTPSTRHPPRPTYPGTSSYQACEGHTYSPYFGPSIGFGRFLDPDSSSSRKSQMEHNNIGCQFNPFATKVTPLSSQSTDTLGSNLKSHAPSRTTWPVPPIRPPCQFEVVTPSLKPIVPNIRGPPNIRQPPYVASPYDSFYGKVPKLANRPVPPSSLQAPICTYPTFNCQLPPPTTLPRQFPRSNGARTRDLGRASPGSTDSVLPPPLVLSSTPSVSVRWPSPMPSASPISASAIPPSPPQVDLQPAYVRHVTATRESNGFSSSVPYALSTPSPAPPLNEAYTSTHRPARALPIPSISKPLAQTPYTPRYTGSTLPRDMHLRAGPPTWGPTPRRLRFAPLPPTPSAGLPYTGNFSSTLPYATPLPPYPLYPMSYPYQAPASQIPPPVSTPYSSWRPAAINSSQYWTPHPVFWYSDGSIVFRVCHSFRFFDAKTMLMIAFGRSRTLATKSTDTSLSVTRCISVTCWLIQRMP